MRTTIYDIAKRAGVSAVTVSRVLNNANVPIAPQTRKSILSIARELSYTPNRMAKALVTGKTHTIALIVSSLDELLGVHFTQLLEAVHKAAQAHGYLVITSGNIDSVAGGGQVDGIVWLANPEIMKVNSPSIAGRLVYVWPAGQDIEGIHNLINWDDEQGMYDATKHLLDLGHRSIAAIWGSVDPECLPPKVKGYRTAMEEAGLDICETWGEKGTDDYESGYLLMRDFLQSGCTATGIIARNDFLAAGAMKAIKESGLNVPGDISVIGYNDTPIAHCADPALTSVRTPMAEAGSIAVHEVLKLIDDEIASFEPVTLCTSLTIRHTCAKPRS